MWWIPSVFAPISLVATWRGAIYSCVGYLVGLLAGELIGEPVYQAQMARPHEQKQDPSYIQNWEPHHPGW